MLIFDDEDDPKWILMQGPWSFDKYLIGLFRLDEAAMVADAKFNTASFWVQIHGLQIRRIQKQTPWPLQARWVGLRVLRNRLRGIVELHACASLY